MQLLDVTACIIIRKITLLHGKFFQGPTPNVHLYIYLVILDPTTSCIPHLCSYHWYICVRYIFCYVHIYIYITYWKKYKKIYLSTLFNYNQFNFYLAAYGNVINYNRVKKCNSYETSLKCTYYTVSVGWSVYTSVSAQ